MLLWVKLVSMVIIILLCALPIKDLFVAGTDTISSTVEWAMAELLCNPEKMAKAQKEIRGVLGNEGIYSSRNLSVLVNAWAIGRDPSTWSNPNALMPERFLECDIDVKGRDFELIPFGVGRRICPGMPLAHRMVHLMLASLLH
ncbi:Cytochrome P450 76C1 [Vitis vinifera]|uniref:Cytochrome P450 76C1 n=1 Tax=Vitis vinifera TaxID=29760 RepID=A0A438IWI7_VITVI|nr:Cytochrome P450 76C1 [Vitis vinifera]